MNIILPSKDEIMRFFEGHVGFMTVLRISELMVCYDHNNIQEQEWQHIRAFLHELKSKDFLLVQNEGQDIHHESFSSTPDKINRYFMKDTPPNHDELSTMTDDELFSLREQHADNSYVPTSRFHKIQREIDRRHQKKIEDALAARPVPPRGKTVKATYKTEAEFIQSRSQGGDEHILVGKRDGSGDKAHVIVDEENGSIRLEDGRQEPTEVVRNIETVITLEDGKQVRSSRGRVEEVPETETVDIEVESARLHKGSTTSDGVAESFSVHIPLVIRNFSKKKVTLRAMQATMSVPQGYDCAAFGGDLKTQEEINGEDLITRNCLFSISIAGRHGGAHSGNPEWLKNKNTIIEKIADAEFQFRIKFEVISLKGKATIEKTFDLNSDILPHILIQKT